MRISLNDNWTMHVCGTEESYPATLPTNNYLVLMQNGVIEDPFYRVNEKSLLYVAKRDYVFRKEFVIEALPQKDEAAFLEINDLDTLAKITLNGKLIAETANVHIGYKFRLADELILGNNVLEIEIASPVNYIEERQKEDKFPFNNNGLNGANHIRKASCQFGWDWGPVLPFSGVGNVLLSIRKAAAIEDFKITQTHRTDSVILDFEVALEEYAECEKTVKITVTDPLGNERSLLFPEQTKLVIENPLLWWANGMTANKTQPLYEVKAELLVEEVAVDTVTKKIGLRTIILDRERDEIGENFCFYVNGKRVFAKGGNWIPCDSFPQSRTRADLEYYIKAAADCNMNMLRVWGGGYYGSDDFYELADEYGVLVWQDCAYACMAYPFYNEAFLASVLEETKYNVRRLRHHASLALWCGNNEIESMLFQWINKPLLIEWIKKYFYELLPEVIRKEDSLTPYVQGSPIGTEFNKKYRDDDNGDTHMWQVWHGLRSLSYYRKRLTRFCSEFGLESLPSENCINSFAEEGDFSLTSEVFNAHQKCGSGNDKMSYYLATKFNMPKNFLDLVYFTGLIQKECVSDASEHWRRNSGRCNGSLFWQINDCWPTSSWSSIDYLGEFKPLQYHARHFFAPVSVSLENNGAHIVPVVINDTIYHKKLVLRCRIVDFQGKTVFSEETNVEIADTYVRRMQALNCAKLVKGAKLKNCVLVADLFEGETLVSRKTCLFAPEKRLNLPFAPIETRIETEGDKHRITLSSPVFARAVSITAAGVSVPFSDNFFDLLPGEPITVTLDANAITLEELKEKLRVKSVSDIDCDKSRLKNFALRMRVLLKPLNLLNVVLYFIN